MLLNRCSRTISFTLLAIVAITGCRTATQWPFAFHESRPPAVQELTDAAAPQSMAPTGQPAVANDAASQQIAAESRALSKQFSVASDPELTNYASVADSAASSETSSDNQARSGSFTSSASRPSSGCSSGCCR